MSPRAAIRKALVPLSRVLTRRKPRVLMYHRFGTPGQFRRLPVDVFEQQLRFLKEHFTIVPLQEIVSKLLAGAPLPARAVALTVDDAYEDFYLLAYPLFEKYRVPVTLYVVGAFADGTEWLWMDQLQYLMRAAPAGRYDIPVNGTMTSIQLSSQQSRDVSWELLADHALGLQADARAAYVREIERAVGLPLPESAPAEFRSVSWDQLRAMDPALVEVGCHSMTHPILSRCEPERQEREILGAKQVLETQLRRPVQSFCYPNGQTADYDDNCIAIVRRSGFTHAVTANEGYIDATSRQFEMPRIGAPTSVEALQRSLDGISWLTGQAGTASRRMFLASALGVAAAKPEYANIRDLL